MRSSCLHSSDKFYLAPSMFYLGVDRNPGRWLSCSTRQLLLRPCFFVRSWFFLLTTPFLPIKQLICSSTAQRALIFARICTSLGFLLTHYCCVGDWAWLSASRCTICHIRVCVYTFMSCVTKCHDVKRTSPYLWINLNKFIQQIAGNSACMLVSHIIHSQLRKLVFAGTVFGGPKPENLHVGG